MIQTKGWEIKKLGDVCSIGDGNYSSKYPKAQEFVSEGVPFLTATNLKSGTIVKDGLRFITEAQHLTLTKGHVIKNDLVIVVRGSSTGNNSIVPDEYEGSNLNSQLAFLRIKNINVDSRYLFSVFNSPEVQKVVLNTISGAAQPQLPNNKLLNIEIPLPPLPEQQRIVSILDECFAAITSAKANAEQNLKNAKELFENYLQEIMSESGFSRLIDKQDLKNGNNKILKSSNHENPDSDKGDGWEEKTIENICDEIFAGGDAPKGNFSDEQNEQYDIPIYANAVKNRGLYGYTNIARVTKPSITIAARGSGTGHTELRSEAYLPIVRLIVLIPNEKMVDLEFLKYKIDTLDILRSGSAIPQLTVPMIKEYRISLPSIKQQQTIVQQLDALRAETQKLEAIYQKKLVDLEELKKSVLQKAFNGEL